MTKPNDCHYSYPADRDGESGYFIGLMSGTSLDGVDAVLASFDNGAITLLASYFSPLKQGLRDCLAQLSLSPNISLQTLGQTDALLGELLAECALAVIAVSGLEANQIRAIGSHGVTVRHAPEQPTPFSLQLGDANRIAEITGITTVADFRRRDIAAGGQGAPLVPAFHKAAFAMPSENRVVLNIGGIANITLLPSDPAGAVTGFDTGPGNTLLDYWAGLHLDKPVDSNGDWGASGNCQHGLLETLLSDAYFQQTPPKSTGKELFSPEWLNRHLAGQAPPPVDVQATLANLTAQSITEAIKRHAPAVDRVLVCGGGVHNRQLMNLLREKLDCPVESTASHGYDPDWVEALAFAWLARQTLLGLPGNLPEVTGAEHPAVLGAIYPGRLG